MQRVEVGIASALLIAFLRWNISWTAPSVPELAASGPRTPPQINGTEFNHSFRTGLISKHFFAQMFRFVIDYLSGAEGGRNRTVCGAELICVRRR